MSDIEEIFNDFLGFPPDVIKTARQAEKAISKKMTSKAENNKEEGKKDNKHFYCYECKFLFSQKSLLDKHMKNHSQYQCLSCDYTTFVEEDLKNHTQVHTNNMLHNCPKCKFSFSTSRKSSLANHVCKHNIPFQCKVCGKGFMHESYMNVHFINHHRKGIDMTRISEPFSCKECGKGFVDETHMSIHLINHHRDGINIKPVVEPFSCTISDLKSSSNSTLQDYIEGHNLPPEFICQICSFECNRKSILKSHMGMHTEKKTNESSGNVNIQFAEEQIEFTNNDVDDSVPVKSKTYTCTYCGQNFHLHMHLKWHILTHSDRKYFGCNECEYKTIRSYNLKSHMRQHADKNLMTCPECDYNTENKTLLENHINSHKENTKGKHFKRKYNCKEKSELSHVCSYCSAECVSLRELTKHMQIHNKPGFKTDPKKQLQSHPRLNREISNATQLKNKNIEISKEFVRLHNSLINSTITCQKKVKPNISSSAKQATKFQNISHNKSNFKTDPKKQLQSYRRRNRKSSNATQLRNKNIEISKELVRLNNWQITSDKRNKNKPITCEVYGCDSIFSSQRNFKKHMRNHKEEKTYDSNDRGYKSITSYELQKHEKNHKAHYCSECDFRSNSMKGLKIHKNIHKTKFDDIIFLTKRTKNLKKNHTKVSKELAKLNNWQVVSNAENVNNFFSCEVYGCAAIFTSQRNHKKHMRNHKEENTYE